MAYLAPSLVRLRNQLNQRWPDRDKASDGWIGDSRHCPGSSDHCADGKGCVHAIDIDKDGISPWHVVAQAIKHPATQYVIFERKIWSRSWGFRARVYRGENPHTKHIHVSIQHTGAAENEPTRWIHPSRWQPTGEGELTEPNSHVEEPQVDELQDSAEDVTPHVEDDDPESQVGDEVDVVLSETE